MNKVIKVTDDEVFVGMEDGSVVKTERMNASWDVQVGDNVELFSDGAVIILNLISSTQKERTIKQRTGVFSKIAKLCQKVFPIAFSALFVLFLTALIVVVSVPRGKKYVYEEAGVSAIITFEDDDTATIEAVESGDPDSIFATCTCDISDGKLYVFRNGKYIYLGKITSRNIIMYTDGIKLEYKENTMITLATLSTVFMSLFAVLDLASVTIMLLIKNGKIKIEE